MEKKRQQLIQGLMEEMNTIMRGWHAINNFPFEDYQLNRSQLMILFFVAPKKEGATVNELAKFIRITPGAVTQLVDSLVEKKLVSREEDRGDRRVSIMKLSVSARKQFNRFRKEYFLNIGEAFSQLSTAEIAHFVALVGKIKIPADRQ